MADSKKYNGSTWEHSLRKLTTATDTFATLPVDVYADGNNATVGISGNTLQNGTPTPDNPIMPEGCGERTGNLFDYQTGTPTAYKYLDENGTEIGVSELAPWYITDYIPIPDGVLSVTLSKIGGGVPAMCAYDASKNYITGIKYNTGSAVMKVDITLTSSTPIRFIRFSYFLGNTGYDDMSTKMLNAGSTALPYEPYGYKIPISSGGATTNIYLGSTQSIRRIGKLILTGDENWGAHAAIGNWYYVDNIFIPIINVGAYCDRYNFALYSSAEELTNGQFTFGNPGGITSIYRLIFKDTAQATVTNFKTYLQQQYANGTPVTVWYVLKTSTTGIVNEPLMKIGDYADIVSDITVPTITGKDTFDVETTLKPSEVSLSYTGWHDATVEKWNGSQWNE